MKTRYPATASNPAKISDVNSLFTSLGRTGRLSFVGVGVAFILRISSFESREMEPGQKQESILNTITGAVSSVFSSDASTTKKVSFSEPAEAKAEESKAEESKAAEVKPAEPKPAEAKPAEAKPAEAKAVEPVAEPVAEPEAEEDVEPTPNEEQPAQQEAVAAPKKTRTPREIKPTDSKSFFKARAKDVSRFSFTPEGDLRVPSIGGEEAKVIKLPFYSAATTEEREAIDVKRREEIHSVEQEYDEISKQVSTAMEEWKSSGDFTDAVRLQKELLALDSRRTSLRSPLRWGKLLANPTIKMVQMHETAVVDEKQKDLKLGYPVMTLVGRPYTFEQTVLPRKEPLKVVVAPEVVETTEESFILFASPTDPEYGLLSPETPLEFVYNTTKYNSILQAYHVERVTQVGRQDMRAALLKLVNPKSIRGVGSRIIGKEAKEIDTPFTLIKDIVKSLVLQDARYAPLLKKTGTDILIYAEPQDKILGVGISIDDEASATNSSKWNGAHNLLGKAWEEVRKTLPKEDSVQQGGAVLESGRTLKDVKEVRSKVLMGYYRRK